MPAQMGPKKPNKEPPGISRSSRPIVVSWPWRLTPPRTGLRPAGLWFPSAGQELPRRGPIVAFSTITRGPDELVVARRSGQCRSSRKCRRYVLEDAVLISSPLLRREIRCRVELVGVANGLQPRSYHKFKPAGRRPGNLLWDPDCDSGTKELRARPPAPSVADDQATRPTAFRDVAIQVLEPAQPISVPLFQDVEARIHMRCRGAPLAVCSAGHGEYDRTSQ